MNQPDLLEKEQPVQLQQLSAAFPYFSPLHYLKSLSGCAYEEASLNVLGELFPVNRVLLYQLFFRKKEQQAAVEEKKQSLFPDEALAAAMSQQDYFAGQGLPVHTELPVQSEKNEKKEAAGEKKLSEEKNLMVVMSFSEWLRYLEEQSRKAREEEAGKSALRAMWQKQKLTAAIEEEEEEIPENVFEMAVNSIASSDEIISESMAAVYALQGKKQKALEMYKKLSLQNPEKSAYFAKKIEDLQKEIDI